MTKDIKELMRRQQARVLAEETLKKAAGPSSHTGGGTYLATSFKQRDDLPVGASMRKMSENVVRNLAALGLHEPISLQRLQGRWWKVYVDAAALDQVREYGCCYVTLYMSSTRLAYQGFEVVDGPFEAWANPEVSRAMLNENEGKYWDATVPNRPLLPVVDGDEPGAEYDDGYTSEVLLAALGAGQPIAVFSGPFETKDDADCAFNLRRESPE